MQYSLSDLSRKFNIPVSTLRYYEKEGALSFLHRSPSGYFLADEADLTSLQLLHCLRDAGCPVKMITDIMVGAERQKQLDGKGSNDTSFFSFVLQRLTVHSDKLLRQQQLLIWQMQIVNYLRWLFVRYLEAGTSVINDVDYPGILPPDFLKNTSQLSFENLAAAYAEKYLSSTKDETT